MRIRTLTAAALAAAGLTVAMTGAASAAPYAADEPGPVASCADGYVTFQRIPATDMAELRTSPGEPPVAGEPTEWAAPVPAAPPVAGEPTEWAVPSEAAPAEPPIAAGPPERPLPTEPAPAPPERPTVVAPAERPPVAEPVPADPPRVSVPAPTEPPRAVPAEGAVPAERTLTLRRAQTADGEDITLAENMPEHLRRAIAEAVEEGDVIAYCAAPGE